MHVDSIAKCQRLVARLTSELEAFDLRSSRPGFANFKSAFSGGDLKKIKARSNLAAARRVLASLLIDSGHSTGDIPALLGVAASTAKAYAGSRSHKPTNKDHEAVRRMIDENQ